MSFFLRKSLRFGLFRFNLSKSGIGVSAGVKGLRIGKGPRGTYINAGRGGVYYRKTLSGKAHRQPTADPYYPREEVNRPQFANSTTGAYTQKKRRAIWPWLVLGSFILLSVMIVNRVAGPWITRTEVLLFLLCFVTAMFETRRGKIAGDPDQGTWIDFDKEKGVSFRIAPPGNRACSEKLLMLAGGAANLSNIDPAMNIEAMIGTVLLDWRGLDAGDKPFDYSPDNARILLSQSEVIRNFVCEQAMLLQDRLGTLPAPEEAANRPLPKVIDMTALPPNLIPSRKETSLAELESARRPSPEPSAHTPAQQLQSVNYELPGLDLLESTHSWQRAAASTEELERVQQSLIETLGRFGISARAGEIIKGANVNRYEVCLTSEVPPDQFAKLEKHLAHATEVEHIDLIAPSDGKAAIGIEVPNAGRTDVSLFDVLATQDWEDAKAELPFALGKDTHGNAIIPNLSELSHVLVAGTTGSGKSVCIDALIASLLFRFPPDELRFVMIDLRRAQMQIYNPLPHLVLPVITDPNKVLLALRRVIDEMEKRYAIFAQIGVRSITSFNTRAPGNSSSASPAHESDRVIPDKIPYLIVIIDELADLMRHAAIDVEGAIARITQTARATGIHLIVATQTPRAEIITGIIKANIPSRVAFHVASKIDSRVILEENGADRLLGEGDMLYRPPSTSRPIRAQGAFVTEDEIRRVVEFISAQSPPGFNFAVWENLQSPATEVTDEDEELVEKCLKIIRQEKRASTSLLQRRLRLGYTRAARIVDILEQRGILGPGEGAAPREILVDLDAG